MNLRVERRGAVHWISIVRPQKRNAVDGPTARELASAFCEFEADKSARVAVLAGSGGHFCAGADLEAVASGESSRMNALDPGGDGPMGPTRLRLSKPVIASISGYCVAGGLELALWCDLRVADMSAVFGVFCRRFGVPLIDGGTVRLPRLIGQSRALDMILTGRAVDANEAFQWGLVNRLTAPELLETATMALADQLAAFPQLCLRNDRRSVYEQWTLDEATALGREFAYGSEVLESGEARNGALSFTAGQGRHGQPRRNSDSSRS